MSQLGLEKKDSAAHLERGILIRTMASDLKDMARSGLESTQLYAPENGPPPTHSSPSQLKPEGIPLWALIALGILGFGLFLAYFIYSFFVR